MMGAILKGAYYNIMGCKKGAIICIKVQFIDRDDINGCLNTRCPYDKNNPGHKLSI